MTATNSRDRALRERAEAVIPGGMYGHQSVGLLPDDYPQFFSRAEGARLWDADGHELIDFMCAYGPNLLGYGHKGVNDAYIRQMGIGDSMTGPSAPPVMAKPPKTMTSRTTMPIPANISGCAPFALADQLPMTLNSDSDDIFTKQAWLA